VVVAVIIRVTMRRSGAKGEDGAKGVPGRHGERFFGICRAVEGSSRIYVVAGRVSRTA